MGDCELKGDLTRLLTSFLIVPLSPPAFRSFSCFPFNGRSSGQWWAAAAAAVAALAAYHIIPSFGKTVTEQTGAARCSTAKGKSAFNYGTYCTGAPRPSLSFSLHSHFIQ